MQSTQDKISLASAAKLMNTTPLNVLMHIKRGLLVGEENEGTWLIDRQSLEQLLSTTGGKKVDDVCATGCNKRHTCGQGCS
ncbi:MAG: hypothetical protein JRE16_07510 [Deltaproteobacteria bacterium]|jgi:hypothetical protein|nr:hypothetical protein [Deltaproteobacteria bacterium]MBW2476766.1 hypothetical protein [Deltaproteobacteria bacterium]MBW2504400.1 hypothetical protein [Deltaproteobacteria bacterium]